MTSGGCCAAAEPRGEGATQARRARPLEGPRRLHGHGGWCCVPVGSWRRLPRRLGRDTMSRLFVSGSENWGCHLCWKVNDVTARRSPVARPSIQSSELLSASAAPTPQPAARLPQDAEAASPTSAPGPGLPAPRVLIQPSSARTDSAPTPRAGVLHAQSLWEASPVGRPSRAGAEV